MTTEMAREYWRNLLRPWCPDDELNGIGRLHHALTDEGDGCVDAHGVLWFRWTPTGHTLSSQLELLVLLAALCATDVRAFEAFLRDLTDDYTQYFLAYRTSYEPPYVLGVYLRVDDQEMMEVVDDSWIKNATVSEAFVQVQRELLKGHASFGPVPLRIDFQSHGVAPKEAIAACLDWVERVNKRQEGEQDVEDLRSFFEIKEVQLNVYDGVQLDVESMTQLTALLDKGVRFPFFQIGTPFSMATTSDVLTQTVRTVQALLGPSCIDNPEALVQPRLEALKLTAPMPTSLAVAVLTAIAHSRTLQRLEIDYNMGRAFGREQFPMDRFWRWLAYALFGGTSHSIQMLVVSAEILSEFDIAIIHEVVAWEDPVLALIDPRSRIESPLTNAVVSIPSGTTIAFVYDYRRVRKDIATFTTTSRFSYLRVLEDRDGWITFLLPGWGECRVRRDEVCVENRQVQVQSTPSLRGIPHLRVEYISHDEIETVCTFLDVVGHLVHRLDIHEFDSEVQNVGTHIVSFVKRCPRLEMLDLFAVKLDSIQPLVDAFSRGECTVRTIKLRQLDIHDMLSMHAFFETLADPSHPMTVCLRELSFHVFEQTIQDASRGSILFSCVEMLAENNQLQVCRAITMSKRRCTQFTRMFQGFDGEPLPARKGPLALRSKLAFLSVVMASLRSQDHHGLSHALYHVDTNVLQTIFEFAAENEIRQSLVEVPVRRW